MLHRAAAYLAGLLVCAASPAAAQGLTPGPPGPYVIDLRAATVAVPDDPAFFPPVPSGTGIPTRAFGVDLGGHVYLLRLGPARIGLGASFVRLRGTASPGETASGSSATAAPTHPDVATTFSSLGPQLSFNFGSAAGWSYLSAGYGRARISSSTTVFTESGDEDATPAASVESGSRGSLNFGGGARWFVREHVAFTFDVRFHLMPDGQTQGTAAPTPGATIVAASAGISLR